MPLTTTYRKATELDFAFLYKNYFDAENNPFLLYDFKTEEQFLPIIKPLIDKGFIYIFEVGRKPAGMFKLFALEHRNAHSGYLGGLAMDPAFKGQGLARHMFTCIFSEARSLKLERIELSVSIANSRAFKLYENQGFKRVGILQNIVKYQNTGTYIDEYLYEILL